MAAGNRQDAAKSAHGAEMKKQTQIPRFGYRFAAGVCIGLSLAGCAQVREKPALPTIQEELRKVIEHSLAQSEMLPAAVEAALAPQIQVELPKSIAPAPEPRFDLAVNAASAQQVFLGIASGTRYSMLLHPEVSGEITVNLKDVSVPEAMAAMRELYGYEYRIEGNRIFVQPLTAQTRFYSIAYPSSLRQGKSELRVISGSKANLSSNANTGTNSNSASSGNTGNSSAGSNSNQVDSSQIMTSVVSDFWGELQASIGTLIGCSHSISSNAGRPTITSNCPEGRNISISPHTGMLIVRALPMEQRLIGEYLKAARVQVERQVMIEAKIIEVTLNEGAQTGINWSAIGTGKGLPFALSSNYGQTKFDSSGSPFINTTADFGALNQAASNTLIGLAFQTDSFAALVSFLETQGQVQVLSSPRIAAINNQKAVLKVGVDEFFITEITSTPNTSGGTGTTTSSGITTQSFFSGIALDVTPQIDETDNIILHVRPSVSHVVTDEKVIDLGSQQGVYRLPLAKSSISETDSVVRLRDGEIAAIGGLMKRESRDTGSGVRGLGDIPLIGAMFKNTNKQRQKQELVILLKPTLIKQQSDWMQDVRDASARLQEFTPPPKPPASVRQ
jgi:MSHA biogenesis protein MshL